MEFAKPRSDAPTVHGLLLKRQSAIPYQSTQPFTTREMPVERRNNHSWVTQAITRLSLGQDLLWRISPLLRRGPL